MSDQSPPRPRGLDTLLIHADEAVAETPALAPPIYQTATFRGRSADEFLDMAATPRHHGFYTRYGNRTHAHAEAVIAALEGAEAAMLTASGMGAISTTVLSFVGAGDHVILQESHYAGTTALGRDLLPRWGVEVTFVDQRSVGAFEGAMRANTRLVVLESPSNPLLRLTDLRAVAALARARGALTVADNTFATPVNQRPLALGVDLVAHSATKFLGGHSDLTAGVVAGPAALVERVWKTSLVLGAVLGPFDAWLLLRGLRTLGVRMERHNRTALAVARFLAAHPRVRAVHYPGLESHPQRALAAAQMAGGSGVVSFELHGGLAAAERFVAALELAPRAASVGGVESLVVHPAAMLSTTMSAEEFARVGVAPDLVRLSVGLEDERDLLDDLAHALDAAAGG
jgi:cystathionine beta-lyase/cystathionine gamma-synthase